MSQPGSQHSRKDDVRSINKVTESQVAANNQKTMKFDTPRKLVRQPMPHDDFDNDKTISFCQQSIRANKPQEIEEESQKTVKKLGFNRQQQSQQHRSPNLLKPQHLHLIELFSKIDACVVFLLNFRQQKSVTFRDLRRNLYDNHKIDLDLVKLRKILYIMPKSYAVKQKKTQHVADADYILIPPFGKMNTHGRVERLKEAMTEYLLKRQDQGDLSGDIPLANIEQLNLEASQKMSVLVEKPKQDFGRTEAIKMIVERTVNKQLKIAPKVEIVLETPKKTKQQKTKQKKLTKQINTKIPINSRGHLQASNPQHIFKQLSQPSSSSTCSTQPPILERLNPIDLLDRNKKTKFKERMYEIVLDKERKIKRLEQQQKLLGKKQVFLSPTDYRHFVDNLNMFYVQHQATNMFKISVINDLVKRLNYSVEDIKTMMSRVQEKGDGYIKTIHLSKGDLLQLDITKGSHMSRIVETINW